ncbi:hypothetical protein [Fusobacterium sp. PH5-44]|uniref:hypothetical protein n=1 Tax=unclassified Fusobacterium TaxID=2648384 RepID=UPI003D1CF57E
MENINEKLKATKEKIETAKEKIKPNSKKWFILSYFGMLIAFFAFLSQALGVINSFMVAAALAPIGIAIMCIVVFLYIVYIITGFILGKVLKKYSLYLAKGFTYGSITIITLTAIFLIWNALSVR